MDHKRKFLIDELSDDDPFSQVDDYCSKRFKNMEDRHYGEEEDTEEEELYIEEDDPEGEVLYYEVEEELVEEEDPEEEGVVEEDPEEEGLVEEGSEEEQHIEVEEELVEEEDPEEEGVAEEDPKEEEEGLVEEGTKEEKHVEEHIEEEEQVEQEVKAETEKIEVGETIGQQDKKFNKGSKTLRNEDDEITVLEGMIDFHERTGNYECDNITAFLEFIEDFLRVKVCQKQLYDKIRRLKEKYKNNKERLEDGQTVDFLKSHEEELFMLSLKIWGSENKEKKEGEEEEDFWSMYPRLNESLKLDQFSDYTLPGCGANYIKQKLSCIGNSKAKELEEKWRKLQVIETQVKLMKARLIEEKTELILKTIS